MLSNWSMSKTFFKYLISYLTVFFLGIGIFVLFIQGYLITVIRSHVINSHQLALEQTANMLDNELDSLYKIDYQISTANDNLHSLFLTEDTLSRDIKIVDELSNYIASSSFINEIALLGQNNEFVYTSSGVYPTELYFMNIFHYSEIENPKDTFLSIKQRSIRRSEPLKESERYITFVNPPYSLSNFPTTTVLFMVNEQQIKKLLSSYIDNDSSFLILDKDANSILTYNSFDEDNLKDIYSRSMNKEYTEYKIDDINYLALSSPSKIMDWEYVVLLPNNIAIEGVRYIQNIFYCLLAIALVIGIIAIWLYMRITYLPVKRLSKYTSGFIKNDNGDEIESLREVMEHLYTENSSLVHTLKNSDSIRSLRDALIFSAIKGQFASVDQFNQSGKNLNLTLSAPNYQVLLLRVLSQQESEVTRDDIQKELSILFSDDYEFYFRELFESNQYVLLMAFSNEIVNSCYNTYDILIEHLRNQSILVTLSAGQIYQDFSKLQTSYLEATLAMRELFTTGPGHTIRYDQMENDSDLMIYPMQEFEDMKTSLIQENYEEFHNLADSLFENLKKRPLPAYFAKGLCSNITYLLLTRSGQNTLQSIISKLHLLNYSESLEEYQHLLHTILSSIKKNTDKSKDSEHSLMDQIRRYIDENYDNCNFSLSDTAIALNMNSSYLSQYFKAQANMTLNDYVTLLRIKKAENLLKSTSIPLNMVAEEVGYYNPNSFIRRFKQITGITPGEYRKQCNMNALTEAPPKDFGGLSDSSLLNDF